MCLNSEVSQLWFYGLSRTLIELYQNFYIAKTWLLVTVNKKFLKYVNLHNSSVLFVQLIKIV